MKLSFFTPTHRPTHLLEAYQSLLRQRVKEISWEWVIVPNGGVTIGDIPAEIQADKRVRIIPTDRTGIGALKSFACYQCSGDVYVELDHDDILASNAAEELLNAYVKAPDGFYYSDFINLKADGQCETFKPKFGWESYRCEVDGQRYTACRAFEPSARSLCQIFYAPNHIRAWSKKAYFAVKGHDTSLTVGDDHDLVCRTYLNGTRFVWIQKPIYIYRRYSGNSFVEFNKDIQSQQQATMNKYLHALVRVECKRKKLRMLDVGRKSRCEDGWESCDIVAANHTIDEKYTNGSIGCIRAFDFFQRVPSEFIVRVMNKFYDLLVPGGWIISATPSVDDGSGGPGRGAFQDPSHRSWWSENNFLYFTNQRFAMLLDGYCGRFQQVRLWTTYPSDWHKQHVVPYVYSDLCALKNQRQPGMSAI